MILVLKNITQNYANLPNDIKINLRNILTEKPLNTFINSYKKENIVVSRK